MIDTTASGKWVTEGKVKIGVKLISEQGRYQRTQPTRYTD